MLGGWLFASAFLWQHSPASFTSTWLMGMMIAVVALCALAVPLLRYVNTIFGGYLVFAALLIRSDTPGTGWHNALVGLAVIAVSLIPARNTDRATRLRRRARVY